jgi:hypothetical protein
LKKSLIATYKLQKIKTKKRSCKNIIFGSELFLADEIMQNRIIDENEAKMIEREIGNLKVVSQRFCISLKCR